MLHKQFIIDVHGNTLEELEAARGAAGVALGTSNDPGHASGSNFSIRGRSRQRQRYRAANQSRRASLGGMLALALVSAAGGAAITRVTRPAADVPERASDTPRTRQTSASAAPPAALARRRVYGYSVVPGGVFNRDELGRAVAADSVVSAHYVGFNIDAALPVKAVAKSVFVSYRKGDQIFWTSHRVALHPGETVLSDGVHLIRARCGNRISDDAREPVADDEPPADVLDYHSDGEAGPGEAPEAWDGYRDYPQCPLPPAGGTPALPHGEVPEPGTFWLLGSGLGLVALLRRRKPPPA